MIYLLSSILFVGAIGALSAWPGMHLGAMKEDGEKMSLNPCKKCGGQAKSYHCAGEYYKECEQCGRSSFGHSNRIAANRDWNHRNPLPPIEGSAEYWMSQKRGGE